jgi:hypothetical protein
MAFAERIPAQASAADRQMMDRFEGGHVSFSTG